MRVKTTILDPKVFSVAANMLGYGSTETKTSICNDIAKDVIEALQTEQCLLAVYPAIIEQAYAQTMDNYRKYIASYNFKTIAENSLTEIHNLEVEKFKRKNELTEVQKEFAKVFLLSKKNLKDRVYNIEAEKFCNEYGLLVAKRKVQTVKFSTEIVFQNLLHLYNSQLMKRNEQYMKLRITSIRPIQEFKVNSYLVTALKRSGVNSIDLCSKTVRNHRQRLEECGVFVDYHFSGQNRPVEVHINSSILVVLDLKNSKLIFTDNQSLTPQIVKVLPDNNDITGTTINEFQKNENVKNISLDKEFPSVTPSISFFTRTPTSNASIKIHAAEKNVKVSNNLSEKLQNLIIHPQELAVNLANHEYNQYTPIDIRYFFKEAYSGTMLKEDFRELVIQDFFKSISKIYNKSTPFAGSWKKAISIYMTTKWIAFTGEAFNKQSIVDDIQQMRWRAEWSRKWFIKNDFPPLFPFDYFDMTRKTSKEVGFEYTKAKWSEHLQSKSKYEALKKKQEANAIRRKTTLNFAKKCENEINRFFKNKITMPQLFDYVEKNLPAEFLEKLPSMIEKKTLKANEKISYDAPDFAQYDFNEF